LLGSIEVSFARENQHDRDHDIADAIRRIQLSVRASRRFLMGCWQAGRTS
jgi:two-component system response regulator FixJ